MTTSRIRSIVSLAAALAITLTVDGCAGASRPVALDTPVSTNGVAAAIRFDNDGREYVHVYLVGEKREWLLGRVEPGARATLRLPDDAVADYAASIRLAVLSGARVSLRAARETPAAITILQPTAEILSQRWTFSQTLATGRLTSLPVSRSRAVTGPQ